MSPAAQLIAPAGIDRQEWLDVRRQGIGGSDVAAMVGLSEHMSPYVLWMIKRGMAVDDEQSEPAYWGTVLEPVVAEEFAKRTGFGVKRTLGTYQHPKHDFMLVNPDGLVCERHLGAHGMNGVKPCSYTALLECKTTSAYQADKWEDDQLPFAAALQVQHGLEVMGLDLAYVPVLIGGQRYEMIEVKRDQELIDMLIEREREFMRRVVENDPPPIDGMASTATFLNNVYDVEPEKTVELPDSIRELVAQREVVDKTLDYADQRKTEINNKIKAMLGDAEIGLLAGKQAVTWKQSPKSGYTVKPTTVRTLRISKKAFA